MNDKPTNITIGAFAGALISGDYDDFLNLSLPKNAEDDADNQDHPEQTPDATSQSD